MKRLRFGVLVALSFTYLADAQKVTRQVDRNVDFSGFHTFKWVAIEGSSQVSQITASNILSAVNAELGTKGMVLVTGDQPADLYVAFQASVSQQQEVSWYNSGGYWMGGMGSATTNTVNIGTLVLDFYNPGQKQLVWRGTATDTIRASGDADNNYKKLQKAVRKLLEKFPPAAKH